MRVHEGERRGQHGSRVVSIFLGESERTTRPDPVEWERWYVVVEQ